MRVLFAAFVVSLVVLVCTLLAFRRHVRKHHAQTGDSFGFSGTPHEDTRA